MPSFSDYAARTPHSYGTGTGSTRGLAGPAPAPVAYALTDTAGRPVDLPTTVQFKGRELVIDSVDGDDMISGPHEHAHGCGWRRGLSASRYGLRTVVVPA
jgi:hypothetical protein